MEDRGQTREKDNNDDEEEKYSGVKRALGKNQKFMCYNTELTKANKDHIKRFAADFLRDVGKVKRVFILSDQENTSNEAKII